MMQVREIRYRRIADELRARIASGELGPGAVLPSEADLAAAHDVSRVTVRKALEQLRDDGLVDSRQGFGWFVAGATVRQPLTELGTIEHQLEELGRASERHVLEFGFLKAPPRVREILGVTTVLRVTRCNLADGQPFALVTVWCPEALGADLSRADVERSTFYELLHVDWGGATQTIGASLATDEDAEHLGIPAGSPLLVCERTTKDVSGAAILHSEHRFPAHRTEFVVDLPTASRSIHPSGLRIVP
jgi:GntR family transcriptional regulator